MQVIDIPDEWTEKLKTMSGEDAKQIYNYYNENKPVKLESGLGVGATTEAALQATGQQFEVLPEAGEIFMGMNQVHYGNALRGFAETQNKDSLLSKLATGFGNAMRSAGEETIKTANRSLEEIRSQQAQEAVPISQEEREGMYFRTAATVPSFAATVGLSMIPYVGPALGAGFVGTQAFAGATTESIESYKQEHPEDKGLEGYLKATDKEIGKIYLKTLASMASEYALGDIPLSKSFKNMLREGRALRQGIKAGTLKPLTKLGVAGEALKAGAKSGGQEAMEELVEGVAYTAIDYDKINTSEELWDRINDSMKDAVAAFFVAGPTGGGVYVASRANAISGVREALKNSMPEQDAATVAAITVDNHIRNLRDVALVSVQASTEFAQKRGEIYDRFSGEVAKAMRESGAFNNMSEEDFVEYVSETASKFADNISGMAIQRKQLIPQVLDANKIVYKDGQLFLEGYKGEQTTTEQKMFQESMDVAQENSRLDAMYPEYTGEEIDINGVQRTVYNSDGTRIAKSAEALRNFYNWFGDSKVVDEQGRPLVVYHGTPNKIYDILKPGTHFTADKEYADIYQKQGASSAGYKKEAKNPGTYAVYLRMENPFDTRQEKSRNDFYKYYYQQMGMGTDLTEKGLPDWNDGRDLLDFITEYHPELGYDGIILDEGGTGGYGQEVKDRGISYVVKDSNQIKSTSNRGTYSLTEDNIYHQEEEQDDKDLVVYHSISENNLKKAIELGGLPAPSLAITKNNIPFSFAGVGGVTLVGTKEMIDPANRKNEVYNRDVWTATFPQQEYKQPKAAVKNEFRKEFSKYFEKVGDWMLSDTLNAKSGYRAIDEFVKSNGARTAYIEKVMGKDVEIPSVSKSEEYLYSSAVNIEMDEKLVNDLLSIDGIENVESASEKYNKERTLATQKLKDFFERKYKKEVGDEETVKKLVSRLFETKDGNKWISEDGKARPIVIYDLVYQAKKYKNSLGKTEKLNHIETRQYLDKIIGDRYNEYQEWAEKQVKDKLLGEPMVMIGNKYAEWNLENITKAMIRGATINAQDSFVYGSGKVFAAAAKKLKTINEIRKEGKNLLTRENSDKIMSELSDLISEWSQNFMTSEDFVSSMDQKEAAYRALGRAAKSPTEESLRSALDYEFGVKKDYSDNVIKQGVELLKGVRGIARDYFEAKPQRAVMLNEFSGAIVPTDTKYDDISQKLQEQGLKVVRSDNQLEAVKEFEDVFFQSAYAGSRVDYDKPSLEAIGTGEGNQAHGWGLYYALSKAVAEKYRETFASEKNPVEIVFDGKVVEQGGTEENAYFTWANYKDVESAKDFVKRKIKSLKEDREIVKSQGRDYSGWDNDIKKQEEILSFFEGKADKFFEEHFKKQKSYRGQVHEVDIPEPDFLLDEQKSFGEQSDFVKEKIKELLENEDIGIPQVTSYWDFVDKVRDLFGEDGVSLFDRIFTLESMRNDFELTESQEKELENLWDKELELEKSLGEKAKDFDANEIYTFVNPSSIDYSTNGRGIYDKISEQLGSDKAASQILEKYGIKGITYDGRQDGRCFVIFNPDDVKVIQKFYQEQKRGQKKVYRGEYNAAKKAIKLFKDANLSTIPHELAHYYLDNMWTYVLSGMASNEYLDNFIAVRDFLGIKKDQLKLTTAQHEKFASAYEKYLRSGKAPNDKLVGAFNGYDRWLKGVYRDINEIKAQGKYSFELTPEMVQFFDNMTTGELMTPAESAEVASIATTTEVKKADDKTVKEAKEVIMQTPVPETKPEFDVKPIETDGKKKESRLFARVKEATEIDGKMDYTVVDLDEQRKKAAKLWQQDPVRAENILNGFEKADDILRSALYTEQQRLALERGDRATFESSVRKQSAEATRMGQELSALRGVVEDITMPAYWLRYAENEAIKQLAKQMTPVFNKHIDKSVLQQLTSQLDADIKELYKKVNALENGKEKANALKEGITDLKKKYKGLEQPDMVFNQTGYEEMTQEYVEKKAKEALGIYLPDAMVDEIIQKARDLDTLSNQVDSLGLPTSAFFAKKAELEATVNRHTPTSQTKVALSIIGRSNMLTAPATTVLNVTTNASNYATQLELRKITNKVAGHTNDILVDEDLRKQYRQKAWKVFWETGYDMSMLKDLTDTRLYKGESITHSEGDGVIRAIGRFAEKWVFSRLISAPDVYFKSMKAFTDFAANEATEIAYKEGLTGEKAKQRATEIWKDAILVEPQTEQGKSARQKAQVDSLVVTFQQDTELSKNLLKLREWINKSTGDIGVGDVLSPFVKTPTNILSMGFDATIGPFASPRNLIAAYNDVRRGQFNTLPVQQAVRQTSFAAIAYTVMALLVSALIDDDDYIPDYSQLTQAERNAVKEAGGAYGSVLIGGTYVSTDFFGPFEMPLVAILNSRRYESVIKGLSTTVLHQLSNAPVLKDFAETTESLKEIGEGQLGILEAVYDGVTDAVTTRAVPNLLNVIAKATDDYERETNRSAINKLKAKVPVLRQTLPEKVSKATGKKVETQPVWLQMLLGSRGHIKVDNKLADELKRLSEAGQGASLSDVTRTGDLKSVPDNKKQRINEEFAKEYSKLVGSLVKTSEYKSKSDEEKKKAINKIRESVVRSLKIKYSKDIKKGLKKAK